MTAPRGRDGDPASVVAATRARLVEIEHLAPPVVVGCSGGPDSLALLALAVECELAPIAVHVDHGLRRGSAAEADRVHVQATRLGASFESIAVRVGHGPNLEARARKARYDALEAVRARTRASAVLVGHTADDQAETVLLNLMRGSATSGLGGMAARRGVVVRPLLDLRRADTERICRVLELEPLHDPMNDDTAFRRVFVRRKLLPVLAEGADRDPVPVLARQAAILRAESDYLDRLACVAWPAEGVPGTRALLALDPVVARRAVRLWLGSPPPSADEVERVLAVARGSARAAQLAGGRRIGRRAGRLFVEPVPTTG